MRMKNPFSDEPGDEESGSGETRAGETEAAENQASDRTPDETAESDGPGVTEAHEERDSGSSGSGEEGESAESDDAQSSEGSGDGEKAESSGQNIAAPSIGPNTVIERKPPEERLDFDKISDSDAMGRDKRREVVGGTYGPTRTRVIGTFVAFFAVVAALAVGFYFLAQELDQPPSENPDVAPWSSAEAPQNAPKPLQ